MEETPVFSDAGHVCYPFKLNFNLRILLTVLHTFAMVVVGRICVVTKTVFTFWLFPISHNVYSTIKQLYHKEDQNINLS